MRQIREIMRLKYVCGLSHRAIAAATGVSKGSVHGYLLRAMQVGLTWPEAAELDDDVLESRLFVAPDVAPERAPIDLAWVHRELRRAGVTLQQLWLEYCAACSTGPSAPPYQYSQFCDHYRRFEKRVDPTMRQVHVAGERLFIDYSGKRLSYLDRASGARGARVEVELYVAVLGASNYTFAEVTRTQRLAVKDRAI